MDDSKGLLQTEVKQEIEMLVVHKYHPVIHKDTDVVWVFSGPGTFSVALDAGDKPWMHWMDRYRVLYGAAIVKEITAKRLKKRTKDIFQEDIKQSGPLFLYNGTPLENITMRNAMKNHLFPLPSENIFIIDSTIEENGEIRPIKNTLDQIKSFRQFPKSLIHNRIAIVSHAEHFPRILRYIEKFHSVPTDIKVEIFPLIPPKESLEEFSRKETEKVWEYFLKGDLAWYPFPVENNQV